MLGPRGPGQGFPPSGRANGPSRGPSDRRPATGTNSYGPGVANPGIANPGFSGAKLQNSRALTQEASPLNFYFWAAVSFLSAIISFSGVVFYNRVASMKTEREIGLIKGEMSS